MKGQAYIFINYEQALKFGHVAWGFAIEEGGDRFCYGSSDHLLKRPMTDLPALLKYSHVESGGDIDFWCKQGDEHEMLEEMRTGHHIRYHAYKRIFLDKCDPELALKETGRVAAGGWSVLTNNCIHHSHSILHAYGVRDKLLVPELLRPKSLMPKHWFNHVEDPGYSLLRNPSRAPEAMERQ